MANTIDPLHEKDSEEFEEVVLVGAPHPFLIREPQPKTRIREVAINDLVARADEYVTVVNGVAIVAPAIRKAMSATEVQWVELMVAIHNATMAMPQVRLQQRGNEGGGDPAVPGNIGSRHPAGSSGSPGFPGSDTSSSSQKLGDPPAPCTPNVTVTYYWWGFRLHLDHCFCKLLVPFGVANTVGAGSTVTFLIAALGSQAAGAINAYIGLAAGLITLMIAWIVWADGYCTPNSGANYNQTWTVQGWITTVC